MPPSDGVGHRIMRKREESCDECELSIDANVQNIQNDELFRFFICKLSGQADEYH